MSHQHAGVLEKKNAIGIWGKKHVSFKNLTLTVAETQDAAPIAQIELQGITRGGEVGDPLILVFLGAGNPPVDIQLKASTQQEADYWYQLVHGALVAAGKARSKSYGLPLVDPRNNLKFVEIPPEFAARFVNLERAVLYWFAAVKKYGSPSRITGKCSTEDRVGFCGDKAFYVTKPNSEVTRCIKIASIKQIFTNVGIKSDKEEAFIVIKLAAPDFDLYIGNDSCPQLLNCLQQLYMYLTRGQELKVIQVKSAQDSSVQLQLSRPSEFEMVMVVPTTKEQLKKALDKFGAKHGIKFAAAPDQSALPQPPPQANENNNTATPNEAKEQAPATNGTAASQPEKTASSPTSAGGNNSNVSKEDPLGCFLLNLGLERFYMSLYKNAVDFDVIEVMDDTDLKNFGVDDDKAIALIRNKIADFEFMEKIKEETAAARDGRGWSKPEPVQPAPAQAAPAPAAQQQQPAQNAPIILDDSDDDLLSSPPSKSQSNFAIVLDSDDDLDIDLPPPAPKPAAAPINLSDDDDL